MLRLASYVALLVPLLAVVMANEPSLQLLPASIRKDIGGTVYISCTALVSDPNLVTEMKWTGPRNNVEIPNKDETISVLNDGPGSLGLLIRNIKENDVGNYTCTAVYAGNQNLEATANVESYEKISFGETPTIQTPLLNTDALIKCMITANPSPHVDWLKDGIALRTDDRHIIQQDGILVKNIQLSDEGVYRCRARVAILGMLEILDIQVEVHSAPEIIEAPKNISGVEKESVTFQCVAEGKPAPEYTWVDPESRPLGDEQGYYLDKVKGELTILDLKPEQSGTYRCTAENAAGSATAEANLRVLTKPKLEKFENITADVDTTAEIRCSFSGDPLPHVIFQKETNPEAFTDSINADDRIQVIQEIDEFGHRVGVLKIHGVQRSDDGLYNCTGNSTGGTTVGWGHITVQFPPTFEQQTYDEFWSLEQSTVNLTCVATSIPNATIQWYLRNQEIRVQDQNLQVVALGPVGVLQVRPLDNSYYGTYTCQATNILGTVEHDITLKQAHKPGPITNAEVDDITATTITWSLRDPTDDGGRPITVYLVQYKHADSSWDEAETYSWTKGSSYALDGLNPTEHYSFRFGAKNEVGNSEWSGEKTIQMPDVSVPEEPMIFMKSEGVNYVPYTNQYDLQWRAPMDNGEPITAYVVIHYQVSNRTGTWDKIGALTELRLDPSPTSHKLRNLRPNTHYRIEVRAQNSIGNSEPAEMLIKTADGVPDSSTIYAEPKLSMGVIIAIVLVALLVMLILMDLICFFSRDCGVTAAIASKIGSSEKDKVAMLAHKNIRPEAGDKAVIIEEEKEAKSNGGQDGPASVSKDSPV